MTNDSWFIKSIKVPKRDLILRVLYCGVTPSKEDIVEKYCLFGGNSKGGFAFKIPLIVFTVLFLNIDIPVVPLVTVFYSHRSVYT